jgi:hypothetical protein
MEEQAPGFLSPRLNEGYRMDMMRKVDELVELVAFHRFRDNRMVKWIEMEQQTWIQPSKIWMFLMTLMTNVTQKKSGGFHHPKWGDGPSLRSRLGSDWLTHLFW